MKKRKSRLEFQAINIIKKRGVAISLLLVITIITIAIVISISGKTQATNEEIEAISDNVNMVKSSDEKWVPVPKGYSASKIPGEDSVDGGFVIYEGEDIDWSYWENKKINSVSDKYETEYVVNEISNDTTNIATKEINNNVTNEISDYIILENTIVDEEIIYDNDIDNITNEINPEITNEEEVLEENIQNNQEVRTDDDSWMLEEDENTFNLQTSRNQWVWIPIDDVSEIYGVDENGKLWGKMYKFNGKGKIADNWTETDGIMKITNLNRGVREPDVSGSGDLDSILRYRTNNGTRYEFLSKEQEEFFYQTIKSIKKYGGFYIGRYETGKLDNNIVVRKMGTAFVNQTWYTMYKKSKSLNKNNDSVTTSLMWSCLLDATLDWFSKSGATRNSDGVLITYNIIGTESEYWGNLTNSEFKYYSDLNKNIGNKVKGTYQMIPAGSTEYTKINNIYDIVGNAYERTLAVMENNQRALCVGTTPQYRFGNWTENENGIYGCRALMIIN